MEIQIKMRRWVDAKPSGHPDDLMSAYLRKAAAARSSSSSPVRQATRDNPKGPPSPPWLHRRCHRAANHPVRPLCWYARAVEAVRRKARLPEAFFGTPARHQSSCNKLPYTGPWCATGVPQRLVTRRWPEEEGALPLETPPAQHQTLDQTGCPLSVAFPVITTRFYRRSRTPKPQTPMEDENHCHEATGNQRERSQTIVCRISHRYRSEDVTDSCAAETVPVFGSSPYWVERIGASIPRFAWPSRAAISSRLLRTPARTAWRRLDLKRYVTLLGLLVVDRVRLAERHQCGRRTLVYRSTYTNCREVKQGICFHVVDEEDQVVCAVAHIQGAAIRFEEELTRPTRGSFTDIESRPFWSLEIDQPWRAYSASQALLSLTVVYHSLEKIAAHYTGDKLSVFTDDGSGRTCRSCYVSTFAGHCISIKVEVFYALRALVPGLAQVAAAQHHLRFYRWKAPSPPPGRPTP
ncbi:hypothetical protein B0H65DRAFT_563265 [Neurospora tetraspora]|uniref:Uncharacterized protein n=1 Tax=Neurospora tetraspora TaxID=94610 RepID=A0AAE0JNN1_9PEZI|nr:hypothetical protein B0H65DRAFT_563265 [Neurospora tetraspora]